MSDKPKTQVQKFKEAARELGCDESEERFAAALRTIARQKPTPNAPRSTAKPVKKPGK